VRKFHGRYWPVGSVFEGRIGFKMMDFVSERLVDNAVDRLRINAKNPGLSVGVSYLSDACRCMPGFLPGPFGLHGVQCKSVPDGFVLPKVSLTDKQQAKQKAQSFD
jgi:hypothetical protein